MGKLDIDNLTYEQFVGHVRSALHYLYDPVHLRNSPLVGMLGLTDEFDRAAALQQLLSAAIRGLKPSADEAPQSRSWRIYDTLNFLYLRQLERDAVALQLGISERQLRREQRVAIERVAQHFWSRINTLVNGAAIPTQSSDTPVLDTPAVDSTQALSEELIWLKNPASEQRITLSEAIHTVQTLAQPLAQQWQVSLQTDVQPDLAETIVSPLALRSILLTILGVAIPRASESIVTLSARQVHGEITCTVRCCNNSCNQMALSEKENASLQTAHELASFYEARLTIPQEPGSGFAATLALRLPKRIPILVIDDNVDWLELLQRYAADSDYQIIGTPESEQAHQIAEKLQPALIFLDVMMHSVDGWQVLSELRQDPATERIPIVICTILPVEELALSLGANQFLQKPVTQQQFLQTLSKHHLWAAEG